MPDPDPDESLLSRLNALKPTSVRLDPSSNALGVSATAVQPAAPPSREDALAARLRTLRSRQGSPAVPSPGAVPGGDPPPPYTEPAPPGPGPARPLSQPGAAAAGPAGGGGGGGGGDDRLDALFAADEAALDEILEGLGDEAGRWDPDEAAGGGGDDPGRVAELLDQLRRDPSAQPPTGQAGRGRGAREARQGGGDDDDDDSEGEEMKRAVDDVLAQALDELEVGRALEEGEDGGQEKRRPEGVVPTPPPTSTTPDAGDPAGRDGAASRGDLSLPSVPTDTRDVPLPSTEEEEAGAGAGADDDAQSATTAAASSGPLSLPAVPTALQEPSPSRPLDFEDEIAARMAALRGLGSPAAAATDAFGLPVAPTFAPADRPAAGGRGAPGAGRRGFTDADQKTWCVACLEDATVRCLGCDGDVFCARCFRDMHVGPAAGYDERGHRWVRFSRGGDDER